MPNFPTAAYLVDNARTQGEVKTALSDLANGLLGLLGAGSGAGSGLTIASGVVAPTHSLHLVDTQSSAATDDLDTITVGALEQGAVVALLATSAARTVYLTTAGNIAHPCLLSAVRPTRYMRVGSTWYCLETRILLDSLTASGSASLDFTKGIGSWADRYELVITDLRPATDADDAWLRLRDGTFQADAADYEFHAQTLGADSSAYSAIESVGESKIRLTVNTGNASSEGASGVVEVFNPGATSSSHRVLGRLGWMTSAATPVLRGANLIGHYNGAQNPVDGMRLLFSSGNIASGRAELWGFRR